MKFKSAFSIGIKLMLVTAVMAGALTAFEGSSFAQGLALPVTSTDIISGSIPHDDRTFGDVVIQIVNYFLGFLGFVGTLMFIYAGVLYVLSGGDEEKTTKAKNIMTYTVIGFVIIILSYTATSFITGSIGDLPEENRVSCESQADCPGSAPCINGYCQLGAGSGAECYSSDQCTGEDSVCLAGSCVNLVAQDEYCDLGDAVDTNNCPANYYCLANKCKYEATPSCDNDNPCSIESQVCNEYGWCVYPGVENQPCSPDEVNSCPNNYSCQDNRCRFKAPTGGSSGFSQENSEAAYEAYLKALEDKTKALLNALNGIDTSLNTLPATIRDLILAILNGTGNVQSKIDLLQDMLNETEDARAASILERLIVALEALKDLRESLDDLKITMPETTAIQTAWNETSDALDSVITKPQNPVQLKRFDTKYKVLKDLIREFPVVQARIRAFPVEGNIPFSVTLNGLDSVDPTGGTIADYRWSFIDNTGNEVSLGNDPVVVHEFTEANTYVVQLRASTSKKDADGFKTASDGVATLRVRANPPASRVLFRINGQEASDTYHITLKEAQAGITFDPSQTSAALGRTITKYEWNYGDSQTESRSTPSVAVHSYAEAGEYLITLTTTDDLKQKDRHTVKLIIKSVAADVQVRPERGDVNTVFSFRGVRSRSDEGVIRTYDWRVEDKDGNLVTENDQEIFSYAFGRPGHFKVVLLVTDVAGKQDTYIESVVVDSREPVANFNYSFPQVNHPNRVEFNAIQSYDPDPGDLLTYSWDFDGDGDFDVINSKEALVTYDYKKVGEYKAKLQVTDSFNGRATLEKNISIQSILSADAVAVTRTTQVGKEIEFKAENSNAVAYLWEFGDSQTEATEKKSVKHTFSKKGKYKVKMNFFDAEDNTTYDTVTVLVGDADRPMASIDALINNRSQQIQEDLCGAGLDGMVVTRADTLNLDASNSINTDGTGRLLSYDWRISTGTQNNKKAFTHRFDELSPANDCFKISLVVRDQLSGKVSDPEELLAKVINTLPDVTDFVMQVDQTKELLTPVKVHLRAVNVTDKDGNIKRYKWNYFREGAEDNPLGTHFTSVPETDMVITAEGQPGVKNRYYFNVAITDNDNGTYETRERFGDVSFLDVTNGPNLSPVAEFTVDKTTISAGDSVTFVSKSYDPQGDMLPNEAYFWDFDGDGEFDDNASGPQVSRQYNTPGEYNVRLKVVFRGLSSSVNKTIFVEPTESLPQAAFLYTTDGNTVKFDASTSRFDPTLKDTVLRFEWDFDVDTDANGNGIKDDDVEATEMTATNTYPQNKIYRARLKVKDSLGVEGVVVRDINLLQSQADREKNTLQTLRVSSPDAAMTSLNLTVSPTNLERGQTADLQAIIFNADSTSYFGRVYFEVVEGSGTISPNPVEAKDSKAASIFTAGDSGRVRIRVKATDTIFGDITEEFTLNIQ